MKLKFQKKTELVNSNMYCLSKELLLFKENGYIYVYNNDLILIDKILFSQDINSIQVLKNEILILDEFNKPSLYSYDGIIEKKPIKIGVNEEIYPAKYESFNKFVINKEIEFPIYQKGIYYAETQYLKYFNIDFTANTIIQDILYSFGLKNISRFDEKTGVKTWHFSVHDFPPYINGFGREQEADIKQIIGIYDDLLWIHVGGFRLVGIDINTGKIVHHIDDMRILLRLNKEEIVYFDFSPFSKYAIHLDEENGILKAFAHRFYIEINLNTLTGQVKKDFGKITIESWRIKNSSFYIESPNLLYFSGSYKSIDKPNAFGIFDTERAEIVWYDTTKDDLGHFYTPPQANDKLLAILDDEKNLLIYEKEDGYR